jgi:protoporphyrinogen oxidase
VDAIEESQRRHRGLALVGGAYRGVGIADCIHSAEEGVARTLDAVSKGGS